MKEKKQQQSKNRKFRDGGRHGKEDNGMPVCSECGYPLTNQEIIGNGDMCASCVINENEPDSNDGKDV